MRTVNVEHLAHFVGAHVEVAQQQRALELAQAVDADGHREVNNVAGGGAEAIDAGRNMLGGLGGEVAEGVDTHVGSHFNVERLFVIDEAGNAHQNVVVLHRGKCVEIVVELLGNENSVDRQANELFVARNVAHDLGQRVGRAGGVGADDIQFEGIFQSAQMGLDFRLFAVGYDSNGLHVVALGNNVEHALRKGFAGNGNERLGGNAAQTGTLAGSQNCVMHIVNENLVLELRVQIYKNFS